MNLCVFTGFVANQPELKGQNQNVLTFRLGVNGRQFNSDTKQWEDSADFLDMTMFGNRATAVAGWLAKGQQVTVEAAARQNTWTDKDGNNRSRVEFHVSDLVAAPKK